MRFSARVRERAEDWLGKLAAAALTRRSARYHAYHSNPLDEDQAYAFGPRFTRAAVALGPRLDSALGLRLDSALGLRLDSALGLRLDVPEGDVVLLAVRPTTRGLGAVRDPFVTLRAPDGRTVRQYVERGVSGLRYLNVSALAGARDVALEVSDLTLAPRAEWLVQVASPLPEPVLIIAPHPDDAELAAFGLYAQHDAWVVTACAGELGTHDYGGLFAADAEGAVLRGKLRVAESLSAPVAGGVASERCANLGYFDGSLTSMFSAPDRPAESLGAQTADLRTFRAAGPATRLPERREATWRGLVDDLTHLMRVSGARTLVFPHPVLDHHADHACLGVAALEAAAQVEGPARFLAYAVHGPGGGPGASVHPVGMRDGTVSLPPGRHPQRLFDGLRSVALDGALRRRKALALDTYRDLKDAEGPLPVEAAGERVRRGLREVYRALVVYDLGLLRRFLRPNELFFELEAEQLGQWRALFVAHLRAAASDRADQ